MADSRALVEKILAGDKGAFRELINQNQRLVAHVVFRMVAGEADREDICQEVFFKVYRHLPDFRFDSKLSTWIARIAHNTCLNFLEKKKLPLYDDLTDEEYQVEPAADESVQPDVRLQEKDISSILMAEIENLTPVYKTIITLYHLDQMSYEEIGQIMKLPEGTVKSYLFRARRMLKDRLSAKYSREEL